MCLQPLQTAGIHYCIGEKKLHELNQFQLCAEAIELLTTSLPQASCFLKVEAARGWGCFARIGHSTVTGNGKTTQFMQGTCAGLREKGDSWLRGRMPSNSQAAKDPGCSLMNHNANRINNRLPQLSCWSTHPCAGRKPLLQEENAH